MGATMFPLTLNRSRNRGVISAAAAAVADAFFRYVTLLLNTTSTNGAQNNTFLDSSTNNFSITRNGNTTQGTFSPFSQTGWSNFFDGTGDYLTTATSGTAAGAFTYEAWVYQTAAATGLVITNGSEVADRVYMYVTSGQQLAWGVFAVGDYTLGGSVPLNQWNHIAIVRSGTTVTGYVNGVAAGTTTTYSGTAGNANGFAVSANKVGGTPFTGYISNARVVNGTAVYTANFTPPTTPLTNIANTSLLTCQSNRFIDNSSNAFAITPNGDVSVQAFSPFNPTGAWDASTNGGSGYFDGTGDDLRSANAGAAANLGATWTVELWVYPSNVSGTGSIVNVNINTANTGINIYRNGATITVDNGVTGGTGPSGGTLVANTWQHVAVVADGTNTKIYLNGTQVGSTFSGTVTSGTPTHFWVGACFSGLSNWTGYLSNARIVKGTAVYTANFTPPTAPLTAITNTSLLCNFTNAGIFDSASGNDLETVGNAQVSTTVAKWGTTSMAFDGTGDEAVTVAKRRLVFGTAPFTVEMWVYCTNAASGATQDLVGNLTNVVGDTNWHFSISTTGVLQSGTYNNLLASSGAATLSSTTWTHVAFTFDGTTYRVFINGTVGTTTSTTVRNLSDSTSAIKVGHTNFGGRFFNGYIDDLRITNGYARYTANFTAPTAAFPLN
jgi:hypothetical protein